MRRPWGQAARVSASFVWRPRKQEPTGARGPEKPRTSPRHHRSVRASVRRSGALRGPVLAPSRPPPRPPTRARLDLDAPSHVLSTHSSSLRLTPTRSPERAFPGGRPVLRRSRGPLWPGPAGLSGHSRPFARQRSGFLGCLAGTRKPPSHLPTGGSQGTHGTLLPLKKPPTGQGAPPPHAEPGRGKLLAPQGAGTSCSTTRNSRTSDPKGQLQEASPPLSTGGHPKTGGGVGDHSACPAL